MTLSIEAQKCGRVEAFIEMKPVHHLLFGFIVTMAFFVLFLPDSISWQVVFLAVISGFLPDFDHREWIWKLISYALFAAFFLLFANSLYSSMPADVFLVVLGSIAASAVVSWAVYAAHPFKGDILDLNDKRLQFWGAEGWFLALYVLIVFAVTLSPAIALAALIAYSSHWVLDRIAYYTYFGRKNLVNYPHPEFGPKWQIRRQQAEERAKREKAKAAAEKKKDNGGGDGESGSEGGHGKPTSKHSMFVGPLITTTDSHGENEHSRQSDEQDQSKPEAHHEEKTALPRSGRWRAESDTAGH